MKIKQAVGNKRGLRTAARSVSRVLIHRAGLNSQPIPSLYRQRDVSKKKKEAGDAKRLHPTASSCAKMPTMNKGERKSLNISYITFLICVKTI